MWSSCPPLPLSCEILSFSHCETCRGSICGQPTGVCEGSESSWLSDAQKMKIQGSSFRFFLFWLTLRYFSFFCHCPSFFLSVTAWMKSPLWGESKGTVFASLNALWLCLPPPCEVHAGPSWQPRTARSAGEWLVGRKRKTHTPILHQPNRHRVVCQQSW